MGYLTAHAGRIVLFSITCASVVAVLLIFVFVIKESIGFFTSYPVGDFLTKKSWYPQADNPEFGALGIIVGSVYVAIGALVIAVPIGLLAAVFLSDIAPFKVQQIFKPIIEILAAIPSVAYGFFAVLVVAPYMQDTFGFPAGTNAMNASIILAVMALPTIISVSEDSLSAVGREIREAAYGLGSTRAETMIKVVIPAAHSGIIAGIILGMMRAIGETMVVLMASGKAYNHIPSPWWDLSQQISTITANIASDMGEVPHGSQHYGALFALGVILFVFTFLLNLVSEYFLSRIKRSTGAAVK
ncbi:MAG: phosphate ABC transporter permease subunit PstC [Sedimentisphaerales bacterium]|nr:phosphate ABC transporter permease subunit PstC [Sedimentisphaerales bacterium]